MFQDPKQPLKVTALESTAAVLHWDRKPCLVARLVWMRAGTLQENRKSTLCILKSQPLLGDASKQAFNDWLMKEGSCFRPAKQKGIPTCIIVSPQ